jgi:hypothetical protein
MAQFPTIEKPIPAMTVASQSFGNLFNPHAHLHAVSSLGVFDQGSEVPTWNPEDENQDPPGDAWLE